jgi:hypothetical protein
MENRLRPWLAGSVQDCGLPRNTEFETVAAVRDAVAYVEVNVVPLCILMFTVKEAFDKISHSYLFALLRQSGFSESFQQRIRNIYEHATSSIQINAYRSSAIPIRSSVPQGCPISMQLFALCLKPLLLTLEENLTGIQIGQCRTKTAVAAYRMM